MECDFMPNFYRNTYYNNYYSKKNYPNIIPQNYRSSQPNNTHLASVPKPPCHPPKKKGPPPKKKFNFKSLKKDTCTSLNDVECFLNKFSDFLRYVRIINLLK